MLNPGKNIGTSTAYDYNWLTGCNVRGIYIEDTVATGYTDGYSSSMRASGGDGSGAIRPFHSLAEAKTGADIAELYGADFYATHVDGKVRTNIYGVVGYTTIEEAVLANLPTGYVQGVLGIYSNTGADCSNAKIVGAVTACVKWDAYAIPDGAFVAFRDGDGAGTGQGAGFKVKQLSTDTIPAFDYGVDLYTENALGGYDVADIRLSNQQVIKSLSTAIIADTTVTTLPAGSLGTTSHDTGKGIWFVSDGAKWQYAQTNSSIGIEYAGAIATAVIDFGDVAEAGCKIVIDGVDYQEDDTADDTTGVWTNGASAAESATSFAVAINGDARETAVDFTAIVSEEGNSVVLVANTVGTDGNVTITTTSGANVTVENATGGLESGIKQTAFINRVVTAQDIKANEINIPIPFTPTKFIVSYVDTDGTTKATDAKTSIEATPDRIRVLLDGATDLIAGDIIQLVVFE